MNLDGNNPFATIDMAFVFKRDQGVFRELGCDGHSVASASPFVEVHVTGSLVEATALVEILQTAVKLHAMATADSAP